MNRSDQWRRSAEVGAWEPSPAELRQRIRTVRWLGRIGFPAALQDSIMHHDCPDISVVRRLVSRYGAVGARERLMRFLFGED